MLKVSGIATVKSLYTAPVFRLKGLESDVVKLLFGRERTSSDEAGTPEVGP